MNNSILTNFINSPLSYVALYIVFVLCLGMVIKVIFFRGDKNKEINIIVNTIQEEEDDDKTFNKYEIKDRIKKLKKISNELAQSKTMIKSCLPATISQNAISVVNPVIPDKTDKSITLIPSYQSNINNNKSIIVSYPQNLPDRLKAMKKITVYAKNTIPSIHNINPII